MQGNKNDFADAQAICEAASRPSMRFVNPRNEAQQTVSMLHRMRESLVQDRTGTINQIHAFLLEFGISLPKGLAIIRKLPAVLAAQELPPRLMPRQYSTSGKATLLGISKRGDKNLRRLLVQGARTILYGVSIGAPTRWARGLEACQGDAI